MSWIRSRHRCNTKLWWFWGFKVGLSQTSYISSFDAEFKYFNKTWYNDVILILWFNATLKWSWGSEFEQSSITYISPLKGESNLYVVQKNQVTYFEPCCCLYVYAITYMLSLKPYDDACILCLTHLQVTCWCIFVMSFITHRVS